MRRDQVIYNKSINSMGVQWNKCWQHTTVLPAYSFACSSVVQYKYFYKNIVLFRKVKARPSNTITQVLIFILIVGQL